MLTIMSTIGALLSLFSANNTGFRSTAQNVWNDFMVETETRFSFLTFSCAVIASAVSRLFRLLVLLCIGQFPVSTFSFFLILFLFLRYLPFVCSMFCCKYLYISVTHALRCSFRFNITHILVLCYICLYSWSHGVFVVTLGINSQLH